MGPMKLYFDIRDIIRAPRLALSGKKIILMLCGTLAGYIIYWVFTAVSFSLCGVSINEMWNEYGLYPCLPGFVDSPPWYACTVFYLGTALLFISISLASTAVSRVTIKQLKGDEFFSSSDSAKYVKKHWTAVVMAPVSIALIITVFILFAGIFAVFGKIPYVGEFLFALPYLFYFFGSLFTVYTGIVLFTSLIYTPAIVAAGEEDTMGTVFQSYSITWSQPWRVLLYNGVLLSFMVLSLHIFRWFMKASFSLINGVFGCDWLMGDKLNRIVAYAYESVFPTFINTLCGSICCASNCIKSICSTCLTYIPFDNGSDLTGTETVSALFLSVFLFIIILSVVSYGLSILTVGETLMYVIFKKKSDNDNLIERRDEDELDEEEDLDLSDDDESSTDDPANQMKNDASDQDTNSSPEKSSE